MHRASVVNETCLRARDLVQFPAGLWPSNGPEEDALEGVEVGALVLENLEEELPVTLEEPLKEGRRQPFLVVDEHGPLDPLEHFLPAGELVGVDDEANVLLGEPQGVEHLRVSLGAED